MGAVCLVGSDFIDTKSKKKDENIVLQKFNAEKYGKGILLLELKHQPKPTQSMPTFDEQWAVTIIIIIKVYHRAE